MDNFRQSLSMVAGGPVDEPGLPDEFNGRASGSGSDRESAENGKPSDAYYQGHKESSDPYVPPRQAAERSAGSNPDGAPFLTNAGADGLTQSSFSDASGRIRSSAGGAASSVGTLVAGLDGHPGSARSPSGFGGRVPQVLSPCSDVDHTFLPVSSADGLATLDHIRELQKVLDSQKKNWERTQSRVNTLHTELSSMTSELKEQAVRLAGAPSRALIQPQFQQDAKLERVAGVSSYLIV